MAFFCQNLEGGGGFAETGLAATSTPPSTCGKTLVHIGNKLLCWEESYSVFTINRQSSTSQNLIAITTYMQPIPKHVAK